MSEAVRHGHARKGRRSKTYVIWQNLGGSRRYETHGVCERWRLYTNFLADMGERPPGMTLDRIDNAKGYSPDNCRWATMKTQQNNRTNNRRITFRGETLTLMQWAERVGVNRRTLANRLDRLGWSMDEALVMPASPLPRRSEARYV